MPDVYVYKMKIFPHIEWITPGIYQNLFLMKELNDKPLHHWIKKQLPTRSFKSKQKTCLCEYHSLSGMHPLQWHTLISIAIFIPQHKAFPDLFITWLPLCLVFQMHQSAVCRVALSWQWLANRVSFPSCLGNFDLVANCSHLLCLENAWWPHTVTVAINIPSYWIFQRHIKDDLRLDCCTLRKGATKLPTGL